MDFPVVVHPIMQPGLNTTRHDVPVSTSPVTLLSYRAGRSQVLVENRSTAWMYVKLGDGVSLSLFTIALAPGSFYLFPEPVYTGKVTAVWETEGSGFAQVTDAS